MERSYFGALAEFTTTAEIYKACTLVRDAGYTRWDAHTPFPVHGLDKAMGLRRSKLPFIVLVMALGGAATGFALQAWVHTMAYPLTISGKPFFTWPAFIPITFELGVLGGALGAVFGMFGLNKLPMHHHPLFEVPRFGRFADDRFFISIESSDAKFDASQTVQLLRSAGASHVELVENPEVSHGPKATVSAEQIGIPQGHVLRRVPMIGLGVGVVAAILAYATAGSPKQFGFSWLLALLFFMSLALGAMFFVLIHYATQAGWGIVVRRLGENMMATIPLFAVLFLPILFLMGEVFPWVHGHGGEHDALLEAKAPFLNTPFFVTRTMIYFVSWSAIAWFFAKSSRQQDATGDPAVSLRLKRLAGPALIVCALTLTFAAIDWVMSLDPLWYSTMFGVYWFAGSFVSFFAFLTLLVVGLKRWGLLTDVVSVEHYHDLGKMLFAFTVFWAYIGFSQYFLIWYANIPEETTFFRHRMHGSWGPVSIFLAFGHFIVPFFFLMPRTVKRNATLLSIGAAWMLLMHLVDMVWLIVPTMHPEGLHIGLSDIFALVAVSALFKGTLFRLLSGAPLVPVKDPRLAESLSFENM